MNSTYKSRRRPWVKLYCRDWMTSTVRFTLSEQDRSRFIDLLALAGDSRFPGLVAAGYESDSRSELLGYPLNWLASQMSCKPDELLVSMEKLAKQGRVKLVRKVDTFLVEILGWKKYQSEYLRQIQPVTKNKRTKCSLQKQDLTSVSSLQKLSLEGEVEVDVEVDVETPSFTPFTEFWSAYPKKVAKAPAEKSWKRLNDADRKSAIEGVQRSVGNEWAAKDTQFIPMPATYLNQRRWEDEQTPKPMMVGQGPQIIQTEEQRLRNRERILARQERKK